MNNNKNIEDKEIKRLPFWSVESILKVMAFWLFMGFLWSLLDRLGLMDDENGFFSKFNLVILALVTTNMFVIHLLRDHMNRVRLNERILNIKEREIKLLKEERSIIGEFTLARQVIAITSILEYCEIENVDKTEIARFIQFITGREIGAKRIQDTNIYKKHLSGPGKSDKKYLEDCLFVANYLQNIGLIDLAEKLRNS